MNYIKCSFTYSGCENRKQKLQKIISIFAPLFLCALVLNNVQAQSGRKTTRPDGQDKSESRDQIKIETLEVKVPLSAYDSTGKFVENIKLTDVLVMEEGEARQVTSIKREPANIVLILDMSNEFGTFKNGPADYNKSVNETEDDAKRKNDTMEPIWKNKTSITPRPTQMEFAQDFITRMAPSDSISIIQYSGKVELVQDWTNDGKQAITSIKSKYRIGLSASYNDALRMASEKLMERNEGRRIILLISDGLDSSSKTSQTSALNAVKKSNATVFVISWSQVMKNDISKYSDYSRRNSKPGYEVIGTGRKRRAELKYYLSMLPEAEYSMRSLAENSGGEIYLPESHLDILKSTPKITQEIGSQYSLAFITERSFSADNTKSIEVISAREGLTVKSSRQYYIGDKPGNTGKKI